jgi:HPt (histidine-containing phosphotransfer) domain-containing protein
MSKINHNAAIAALNTFAATTDAANVALVSAMRAAGVLTLEQAQPIVLEWASEKEMFTKQKVSLGKCGLVDGQRIAAGRKVLDSNSPAYEAAKKTYQRAMAAFEPVVRVDKSEAESAATIKKATKAEREAHALLQAAREAWLAACGGDKNRAKALDKALSA